MLRNPFGPQVRSAAHSAQRSSVLAPLNWPLALLITALGTALWRQAPEWVVYVFVSLIVILVLATLYWYGHFAKTDRDALRSEHFTLRKMEIEHGLVGDDRTALVEPASVEVIAEPVDSSDVPPRSLPKGSKS